MNQKLSTLKNVDSYRNTWIRAVKWRPSLRWSGRDGPDDKNYRTMQWVTQRKSIVVKQLITQ